MRYTVHVGSLSVEITQQMSLVDLGSWQLHMSFLPQMKLVVLWWTLAPTRPEPDMPGKTLPRCVWYLVTCSVHQTYSYTPSPPVSLVLIIGENLLCF